MEANRRTNHYKTFDLLKLAIVLKVIMNNNGIKQTLKFTKSDLRKWFENYNHTADFGKMDFNAFWNNVRGVECDYILSDYKAPKKSNDGWIKGVFGVAIAMGLFIAAIAFYEFVLSFFKQIAIYY